MGDKSNIEWTDATWNPLRGCSRVSDGCTNCYAESIARRFDGEGQPYEGLIHRTGAWNGKITLVPEKLVEPLRWMRGRRIFVNSMSDLFHESVPFEYIDRVFLIMGCTTRHTYQILTKRPRRMLEYFARFEDDEYLEGESPWQVAGAEWPGEWTPLRANHGGYDNCGPLWPFSNVWLGVSVEDQATADERIPLLLQAPAAVRFLSCEPLLGPLDIYGGDPDPRLGGVEAGPGLSLEQFWKADGSGPFPGIDWVICGGESGPHARPMHPDWVRSLRDQCQAARVPFHFKQWGEWTPGENVDRTSGVVKTADWFARQWYFGREDLSNTEGHFDDQPDLYRVGKKAAGRRLDGEVWDQYPLPASNRSQ